MWLMMTITYGRTSIEINVTLVALCLVGLLLIAVLIE